MRISHFEHRSDGSDGQVNGARVRSASRQERIARAVGAQIACYTWPMQWQEASRLWAKDARNHGVNTTTGGEERSTERSRPASAWTHLILISRRHVHHWSYSAAASAREPVCLHRNAPGELAPLSRSAEAKHRISLEQRGLAVACACATRGGQLCYLLAEQGQIGIPNCTATACHSVVTLASTIVALLCGDPRRRSASVELVEV